MGPGEGVLARGERGMWPTDLRREGEWRFLVLMCSLCLSPCREEGRAEAEGAGPAGEPQAELSPDSPGEEMGDSDRGEGECSLV